MVYGSGLIKHILRYSVTNINFKHEVYGALTVERYINSEDYKNYTIL